MTASMSWSSNTTTESTPAPNSMTLPHPAHRSSCRMSSVRSVPEVREPGLRLHALSQRGVLHQRPPLLSRPRARCSAFRASRSRVARRAKRARSASPSASRAAAPRCTVRIRSADSRARASASRVRSAASRATPFGASNPRVQAFHPVRLDAPRQASGASNRGGPANSRCTLSAPSSQASRRRSAPEYARRVFGLMEASAWLARTAVRFNPRGCGDAGRSSR